MRSVGERHPAQTITRSIMVIERGSNWKNKKNGKSYTVLIPNGINATNDRAGQVMVTLVRSSELANPLAQVYHRAILEFLEKFEEIKATNEYFLATH